MLAFGLHVRILSRHPPILPVLSIPRALGSYIHHPRYFPAPVCCVPCTALPFPSSLPLAVFQLIMAISSCMSPGEV